MASAYPQTGANRNPVTQLQIPPDVQAILDRMKLGTTPRQDERKKIAAWESDMVDAAGASRLGQAADRMEQSREGLGRPLNATGLGPSSGGVLIESPVRFTDPVTVETGSTPVTASCAGPVGSGEFQINFTVPNLAPGNYSLVVGTGGASSQTGVVLPMGN